jgi:hypothetical protein
MQFDFNLGANQSQHIDVVGTFLKYKAGTGMIRVRLNGGGYIDLLPGQGVNNVNFTSVDVQDRTGAANSGTLLAGMYDFRDDRITGTVDVVDGGKARTKANMAFSAAVWSPASAGNYTTAQIFNPAGSGKNVVCSQIILTTDFSAVIVIGWNNQANGALLGTFNSKLSGGASSVAQQANNGLPGLPTNFKYLGAYQASTNAPFIYKFAEPVVLQPGYGLSVQNNAMANGAIQANFEFIEEPI